MKLTNLKELYLGSNSITNIPPEICQLSKLEKLYLNANRLETLPKEIGKLTNLQELCLTMNKIKTLPKELECLINLKKLFLSDDFNPVLTDIPNLHTLNLFNFLSRKYFYSLDKIFLFFI